MPAASVQRNDLRVIMHVIGAERFQERSQVGRRRTYQPNTVNPQAWSKSGQSVYSVRVTVSALELKKLS